jgi:capsular polysaccharide transport system permease protein
MAAMPFADAKPSLTRADALDAARVQGRVIHAVVLREVKTMFGRYQLGYIWALIEPIMYVAVLVVIFNLFGRASVAGMPLSLFIITGILPYLMFVRTVQAAMQAVEANRALLTFPQVTPIDIVAARTILQIVTTLVVFAVIVVGVAVVLGPFRIADPMAVAWWLIAAGLLGAGAGAFFGAWTSIFPAVERLVPTLLSRPLFFVSGVFFTADLIPENVRPYALLNPLLHVIELLRSAFFPDFDSAYGDPGYAFLSLAAAVFLGLLGHRAFRKQILVP